MNESTENDPFKKSPPNNVVDVENANKSQNVESKNLSLQNNSVSDMNNEQGNNSADTNNESASQTTANKNMINESASQTADINNEPPSKPAVVNNELERKPPDINNGPASKPADMNNESASQTADMNNEPASNPADMNNESASQTADMNNGPASKPADENVELENKAIKKEPGIKDTIIEDNKSLQNDPVIETKMEENSATNQGSKTVSTTTTDKDTKTGKVIVINKMHKNTNIDDVSKLIKDNTNNNVKNFIDTIYMIVDPDGARAVVSFKTEEHAALARTLLEVMTDPPFANVSYFLDNPVSGYGTKRAATDSTSEASPVPQKQTKLDAQSANDNKAGDARVLFLCNVPTKWSQEAVINFIKVNTRAKPQIYKGLLHLYRETDDSGEFNGNCHLLFEDTNTCGLAFYYLRKANRVFNSSKILIEFEFSTSAFAIPWLPSNEPDLEAIKKMDKEKKTIQEKNIKNSHSAQPHYMKLKHDNWTLEQKNVNFDASTHFIKQKFDPFDTYGISLQFLETLGIKPPLATTVCVLNLSQNYGDEEMIRKLFSHAGNVKEVTMFDRKEDNIVAKVDFDHPLEAVQAISMFNNLEVFKKRLKVTLDRSASRVPYPPGVLGFGPGLCPDGSALKNVRNSIELQRAVNMLISKIDNLKDTIQSFHITMQNRPPNIEDSLANAFQTSLASMAGNFPNAQTNPLLALGSYLNPQALQFLHQPQAAGMLNPALPQLLPPSVVLQAQNPTWNAGIPAQGQLMQPAVLNIMEGTPFVQPVANVQTGAYVQGAPQMQAAVRPPASAVPPVSYTQAGINAATGQYAQTTPNAPIGQHAQGSPNVATQSAPTAAIVQNVPAGQFTQGGPNSATGQYTQGRQNMPPRQFAQGVPTPATGQNMPTGQFVQGVPTPTTGQNMPAGQFAQGGPNAATGQYAQGGQNMPAGQFAQGGPNAATGQYAQGGQNVPSGQFSQGGPNAATGQYAQGGQNMPPGQFSQSGPNAATGQYVHGAGQNMPPGQFAHGGPNAATGQYAQGRQNNNMPSRQFTQGAQIPATGQNMPAGQFAQSGPNAATGQYAQGGQNMPLGQFAQGGPNAATGQYAQGGHNNSMPARQFTQDGPIPATGQNMPVGQFAQGGPNAATGQYAQGGQNMPAGQFTQGGPNAATGQYAQGGHNNSMPARQFTQGGPIPATGQNMPAGQFAQVGPNAATGQYAQGGHNNSMPARQFTQGGPIPATGQNMPAGQFSQGGPNVAPGQFAHGSANVSTGQYPQSGQNVPFNREPNASVGQGNPNQPDRQIVQSGPQSGPGNPSGQYNRGGPNIATDHSGPNLPPQKYDRGRSTSSERYNQKMPKSQVSPDDHVWLHDSCTVMFSYLPPSVTLSALKSKMAEVGKVRAAEIIGPGRARVAFYASRDADDCIQLLDHTKVDGQTIEVKYY